LRSLTAIVFHLPLIKLKGCLETSHALRQTSRQNSAKRKTCRKGKKTVTLAGSSPGFSSRGGHIFKIQYWMYVATGRPNVKREAPISNGGPGTTGLPAGDSPGPRMPKIEVFLLPVRDRESPIFVAFGAISAIIRRAIALASQ